MTDRIAVLIDADNTSHRYAADLLAELAKFGRPTVKRAYGDWRSDSLKGWAAKLNQHAISPEQTMAYTVGKNSTDSALIIDAMNKAYVEYFAEPYPTRATVVVKELIGGKARVEIQAQAWLGK